MGFGARLRVGENEGTSMRRVSEGIHPRSVSAPGDRRERAAQLQRAGQYAQSLELWHAEVFEDPAALGDISRRVGAALSAGDLALAGDYAALHASLRWGTLWYPPRTPGSRPTPPLPAPVPQLSVAKLEHDCDQILYLQRQGVLGDEFSPIIGHYRRIISRLLASAGTGAREQLRGDDLRRIGHVYNRIVHVRDTPRVSRALSQRWDPDAAEDEYLASSPGIVVVDDFLSAEALESLRKFCLESTVWSTNRYAHGRLGSFFRDGFNCPLLIQIAEELRAALPRVIAQRHRASQMWGFKYANHSPGRSTHADFAAVNVNFWLTPDEANLNLNTGGLVIYDVQAPLSWDFAQYNRRTDLIHELLDARKARAITIPYRQNRVVIFDSNLFHSTAKVHFRPDYESRRVNVTFLYGDREQSIHRARERPSRMATPSRDAAQLSTRSQPSDDRV